MRRLASSTPWSGHTVSGTRRSQDQIHNSEHTLSSITVTSPDLKHVLSIPAQPQHAPSESPKWHRSSDSGSSYNGSSCTHTSAPAPSTWLPTAEDAHTAVPHPNAYCCRKHNCWVLLIWKPSSMHPPLVHSFTSFLLDHSPHQSTNSCVRDSEQVMGMTNVTHHFHAYVIPSVTPVKLLEDFIKNTDHKKQGLESRNEDSSHVKKRQFQTKPAGTTRCEIYPITQIPKPPDLTLSPPHIDDCTPTGRLARSKLLRTWVELEAWVADCSKRFGELKLPQLKTHVSPHKLWVKIDSAQEEYQRAIRAHPDQSECPSVLGDRVHANLSFAG
ncbi:hypothetical protein EI94DRAFT_1708879 [Lactarius quietus]|nr:hypothetical protein EI94DRAFT_1708879 [Lactarius quietus]